METLGVVAFLAAFIVILALLVGVGYLIFRSRSGDGIHLNQRLLLRVYMYLGTLAGLVLLAIGLSGLVRAGLGAAAGYEFSYYPQYVAIARPVPAPGSDFAPLQPTPQEQQEVRERGLKRAYQEGLLNGFTYTVVGALVLGVHIFGRRKLTYTTDADVALERGYLLVMVLIFGVITLVNLPQGVFETLRFYLLEPLDEFSQFSTPGDNLGWTVVALPIWLFYLSSLIRSVRHGNDA